MMGIDTIQIRCLEDILLHWNSNPTITQQWWRYHHQTKVTLKYRWWRPAQQNKNALCAFQIECKLLSFILEADDQYSSITNTLPYSSITKGSIYHIKKYVRRILFNNLTVSAISNIMFVQPFTTGANCPEIGRLIEISSFCTYCVFTGYGSYLSNTLFWL